MTESPCLRDVLGTNACRLEGSRCGVCGRYRSEISHWGFLTDKERATINARLYQEGYPKHLGERL